MILTADFMFYSLVVLGAFIYLFFKVKQLGNIQNDLDTLRLSQDQINAILDKNKVFMLIVSAFNLLVTYFVCHCAYLLLLSIGIDFYLPTLTVFLFGSWFMFVTTANYVLKVVIRHSRKNNPSLGAM